MEETLRSPQFFAFVILAVLAEWTLRRSLGHAYDARAAGASFAVALGQGVAGGLGALVIVPVYLGVWELAPIRLPTDDWRVWAAGFFLMEFAYYWMHRFSHTVRWLWATHAVHHSAEEFTLPAAIRLGWTGLVSGGWLFFTPVIALGFHPLVVVILLGANLKYQFLLHTELFGRLGPLEAVFNTPSHHRIHHASNPRYLDRNFGGVLIIFDRLFGTFAEEDPAEPCRYGLTEPLRSYNPFVIALHEWARMAREVASARGVRARARALFGRPGSVCVGGGVAR